MAKFKMGVTVPAGALTTARLGSAASAAGRLAESTENGKFVKLAGDSQYDLASAGDQVEAMIWAFEPNTADGWTIGSVQTSGRIAAVCDGLEATPGTGTIAVGDFVVVGTAVAKDTALTGNPRVCKATNQPGATVDVGATVDQTNVNIALAKITDAQLNAMFAWRVVSVGTDGTVDDSCIIERVNLGKAN